MSKLTLTLLPLLLVVLPANAQEDPAKRIPWANKFFTGTSETPPPVILHDFGTLPQGTVRTYRFKMTNIYAFPVQVKLPKVPSCACVSVIEYTGLMNPRETGHIDIKIDTSRVEGPKNVDLPIRFECSDPKTGEALWSIAQLEVRALIRKDITINPGLIAFGVVPVGQKANQSVNVVYSGNQRGWAITDAEYKKELMDVQVTPVRVRGGIGWEISASLKPNAPAGAIVEQVVLKTNDPVAPVLTLAVTGEVQAPLSLRGPGKDGLVRLGQVEVGKKSEQKVIVESSEKKIKIASVEGQGDFVSVFVGPSDPGKKQVITVIFKPEKAGPVKKVLTIKTDTGDSVSMTVEALGLDPQ